MIGCELCCPLSRPSSANGYSEATVAALRACCSSIVQAGNRALVVVAADYSPSDVGSSVPVPPPPSLLAALAVEYQCIFASRIDIHVTRANDLSQFFLGTKKRASPPHKHGFDMVAVHLEDPALSNTLNMREFPVDIVCLDVFISGPFAGKGACQFSPKLLPAHAVFELPYVEVVKAGACGQLNRMLPRVRNVVDALPPAPLVVSHGFGVQDWGAGKMPLEFRFSGDVASLFSLVLGRPDIASTMDRIASHIIARKRDAERLGGKKRKRPAV